MTKAASAIAAGTAGAVIGATAGAILGDKKTRNFVKGKLKGLQKMGTAAIDSLTEEATIKGGQTRIKRAISGSKRKLTRKSRD